MRLNANYLCINILWRFSVPASQDLTVKAKEFLRAAI